MKKNIKFCYNGFIGASLYWATIRFENGNPIFMLYRNLFPRPEQRLNQIFLFKLDT
jgi:hypothetical protein